MKAMITSLLFIVFALPAFAEKGDIYDCKFKVKRGQWLVEQVVVGIGHKSGLAMVYDGMIHKEHGKPIEAKITRDEDKRMVLKWAVFLKVGTNPTVKVNMLLTYHKSNKKAGIKSNLSGYENFDTARGACTISVGNV